MFKTVATSVLVCLGVLTMTVGCVPTSSTEAAETPMTDLSATIEVPATLTSGEAVKLRFTLSNNTAVRLYVLKWYTPLEGIAGEIFLVKRDGQLIPYQGILATRLAPPPEAYVLLEPGESVSAEVDLATAYDLSEPGEYTISFISPRISHVARTESEMAKTLDDLGPVRIPSNRVSVTIASATGASVRRTSVEAAEMIREHLRSQKPDLKPGLRVLPEELPMREAWEHMQLQVFRITEGAFLNESFLIRGGVVLPLGTAVGGCGVTSFEIGDLDRDGSAELLFTYSFGSGIHQSRIGMYAPAYDENRVYEATTWYLGDLVLFKEDRYTVGVKVVESDVPTGILHYHDTLGYLAIEEDNGQVELALHVAEDLPGDVRQNVIQLITQGEEGAYPRWVSSGKEVDGIEATEKPPAPTPTPAPIVEKDLITYVNEDYGLAFIYPSGWELEEIPAGQEVPGGESATAIHLTQGSLRLAIQVKRVEEATVLGPSGRPAGKIEERTTVMVLGRAIPKQVLVYEGKVKSVFVGGRFDDLELYVQLDDGVGVQQDYDAIEIPESAQSAMESILSSVTRTGEPHSSGADTLTAQPTKTPTLCSWALSVLGGNE